MRAHPQNALTAREAHARRLPHGGGWHGSRGAVDRKGQGREVRIHTTDHQAKDGDLVTVDMHDRPGPGLSAGKSASGWDH